MQPIQIMIVGAQKAGTSSLKTYLGQHPGVCTHRHLEMMYFVNDAEYEQGYPQAYQRYFQCEQKEGMVLLAKSVGILDVREAMKRLQDHNPDVRLVLSFRHPVDRAYSAYWYARRIGWEKLETFEEAVDADPARFGDDVALRRHCAYKERSLYAKHLGTLWEYFEREQTHVFLLEDIVHDAAHVCRMVFRQFENLDPSYVPQARRRQNVAALPLSRNLARLTSSQGTLSTVKSALRRLLPDWLTDSARDTLQRLNERQFTPPPMEQETRQRLIEFFRPANAQLAQMLGRDLSHWDQ
jgi:hypothetical protein